MWSWSHSDEAYNNLKINIRNADVNLLKAVLSCILTFKYCVIEVSLSKEEDEEESTYDNIIFTDKYYKKEYYEFISESEFVNSLVKEHINSTEEFTRLTNIIYNFSAEIRLCDSGGYHAYLDPYCYYILPFDLIKEKSDE